MARNGHRRGTAASRPPGGIFALDPRSQSPKYRQIAERVVAALRAGALRKGDRLPSINEACRAHRLSRDTVVKAYDLLQEMRYLSAIHGKGYFLRTDAPDPRIRAFVVFDTLNAFKEKVFAGFTDTVSRQADSDVCFHHFNPVLFHRLLLEARGKYDRYVVMPFPAPEVARALEALEHERLLVLDIDACAPRRATPRIVQNFDDQLVQALERGLSRLRRYRQLVLVFPPDNHDPVEIQEAVLRFGRRAGLATSVVPRLTEQMVEPRTAYLVLDDNDLVHLVKHCNATGHRLGQDVGVLSYNDTPLKEIVAGGISVVSIDFYGLGVRAGQHVLDPRPIREVVPTRLILRNSL
ncbi:MAG TPA: GntR family transcriptional regulator [Anaeromyxobacter sp.]|nr:GntR family transcriptional regulator [Anaeromyxobacter sp.]